MRPVKYIQWDGRWGSEDYSAPGEKTTIAKAGCGPTCMAMVIATLKNAKVTPSITCLWSKNHGYKAVNQGTYYSYFAPQGSVYGLEVRQLNTVSTYHDPSNSYHAQALQELKNGNWLIACMGPGKWTSSGHFILVYDLVDDRVCINDPNSEASSKESALVKDFINEVKYYFVVNVEGVRSGMTETEVERIVQRVIRGETTKVSSYAQADWNNAISLGITDGTRPGGCATREEVISMISRALRR